MAKRSPRHLWDLQVGDEDKTTVADECDAGDETTFSGYTVPPNDIANACRTGRRRKTLLVARRFLSLAIRSETPIAVSAKLMRIARKLVACDAAYKTGGNRCCQVFCPRCQRIVAVRYRRKVQDLIQERSPCVLQLFTATVACDSLSIGHEVLQDSLRKLRRRKTWRETVAGGVIQLDYKPAERGSTLRWNVHCHAILEMFYGAVLDQGELQSQWSGYLAAHGLVGDIDLRRCKVGKKRV